MAIALLNNGVFVETVAGTSHTTGTIVTLSAGTNRKLLVNFGTESSGAVSAAAFDGTSFVANAVSSVQSADDTQVRGYSFYYDIPDAKAATDYAITWTSGTSSANWTIYWEILSGASTGAPEDADTAEWGTESTNATITLTCTDGAWMVGMANTSAASQTWTVTGSVTERTESNETNYTTVEADGAISGSGSKTFTATVSSAATGNKISMAMSIAANAQSAAVTGTLLTAPILQSAVVAGGSTIIATLTGDTFVASGATFDAQRQAIINGLDSAGVGATGWDAVVKAGIPVTAVVRTSNTVVTITLPAFPTYSITTAETVTWTLPAAALTLAAPIVAAPTFTVLVGPRLSAYTGTTNASGVVSFTLTSDDPLTTNGEVLIVTATSGTSVSRTTVRPATP